MRHIAYRILALLAGAALVVTGLVSSLGAAIIVPIAMWVTAYVHRRRGRVLTPPPAGIDATDVMDGATGPRSRPAARIRPSI
jgi:hypothetical protein